MIGGAFVGGETKVESSGFTDIFTWITSWYPAAYEYGSQALGSGASFAVCADGQYSSEDFIFGGSFDY
jgi:hypothetical protein